jgi:hypothetical protein
MQGYRLDVHGLAGAENPERYFPAIRNDNLFQNGQWAYSADDEQRFVEFNRLAIFNQDGNYRT